MISENVLVSIIIPTLNEEKYIEDTLLSIKNQTYKNIEVVVSDGCSNDKTVCIAKKYADMVIVKKTNIAAARNIGVKCSKGEIIVFLDADSWLEPVWIERTLKAFDKSNCDLVFGRVKPKEDNLKARIICKFGWDLIPRLFTSIGFPQFTGVNIAIKRPAFYKIGGFREEMNATEDIDLGFRIKRCGKTAAFNKHVECYTSMRRFEQGGYLFWLARMIMDWMTYILTKNSSYSEYPIFR